MTCQANDIVGRIVAQRALQAVLAKSPRPCAFRCGRGCCVVHLNTHPGHIGEWRVTMLDADGEPMGHLEAGTFDDALTLARTDGADLADEIVP